MPLYATHLMRCNLSDVVFTSSPLQVHKAQPIRHYKPVALKKSEVPLTVPHSPNFSDRFRLWSACFTPPWSWEMSRVFLFLLLFFVVVVAPPRCPWNVASTRLSQKTGCKVVKSCIWHDVVFFLSIQCWILDFNHCNHLLYILSPSSCHINTFQINAIKYCHDYEHLKLKFGQD